MRYSWKQFPLNFDINDSVLKTIRIYEYSDTYGRHVSHCSQMPGIRSSITSLSAIIKEAEDKLNPANTSTLYEKIQ